ncbi:hypothetical protein [Gaoshiqia sp. Z1-71]|uniref:hypothetical protein n=1 Tax=Gaoshiqia hydrogeniformans TaxID=3290090 RepID=UPI003BF82D0F
MKAMKQTLPFKRFAIFMALLIIAGCATISAFDQYAYTQTTSAKVDALNVMELATEAYEPHKPAVKELETKLQKIYEYEKNRPKNEISTRMWDKLLDKEGHLLGGFLVRWKEENMLNPVFVNEMKTIVDQAFDQIAGLESKKIKKSQLSN